MATIDPKYLKGSDGTGSAVLANITVARIPGATTLKVNNLDNWPPFFIATTGTLNANGYIVEAGKREFRGHITGSDIIIDGFEPGFTDDGNSTDEVVILKQTTGWADGVADNLVDLKAKDTAIDTDIALRQSQISSNFVVSGAAIAVVSGLTGSFSDAVYYHNGVRKTKTGEANRLYTASRDTYVFLELATGTITYTAQSVGSNPPPTTPAGNILIAVVTTNATTFVSVTEVGRQAIKASNIDFDSGVWWEEVGRTTLLSPSNFCSTPISKPKKFYKVLFFVNGYQNTITGLFVRLNGDANTRYASRLNKLSASYATSQFQGIEGIWVNQDTFWPLKSEGELTLANPQFNQAGSVWTVSGVSSHVNGSTAAAATVILNNYAGAYFNTSPLTGCTLWSNGGGQMNAGTVMVVLGHD